MIKSSVKNLLLVFAVLTTLTAFSVVAQAQLCAPSCGFCSSIIGSCQNFCICVSNEETGKPDKEKTTIGHVTDEFKKHRKWMVDIFFYDPKRGDPPGLRAAMKIMTSQLTAIGIQQVQVIGTFFDAKHQLETQRLFQTMVARAHKDYHPSEELCEFGTATRSLAASFRNSDLAAAAISRRSVERQLLAENTMSNNGKENDQKTRLVQFIKKFCNPLDDAGSLDMLCMQSEGNNKMYNKDINYTSTLDNPLTLELDFSTKDAKPKSEDEQALFALSANIFANDLFSYNPQGDFVDSKGEPDYAEAGKNYLDARAIMAKHSVAVNSFSSIAALKTQGDEESQPFLYALIKEMGGDDIDVDDIKKLIGERPSYYAQMEILTKKLYQSPKFYADLYDKPANVMRKDVAIQAANLMQKRDLYRSYLRSEMVLAVMLETALASEQEKITNETNPMRETGIMK